MKDQERTGMRKEGVERREEQLRQKSGRAEGEKEEIKEEKAKGKYKG